MIAHSMTDQQSQHKSQPHNLQCLEVWGGSSSADHAASVPGLDISVCSRPVDGAELGGDLYLISSCSSGWVCRILLADVSGHGLGVSELSTNLRKAMHKSIGTVDQSKLARSLNKSFDDISGGTKFATALLMTYYAPSGHLIFVNAGHPPPLLRRVGTTSWESVDQNTEGILKSPTSELRVGIKNLPLGVIDSTEYEQIAIKINHGDLICVYTDAFTEAQREDGTLIGVDGLADVLSKPHVSDSNDVTRAVLDEFTNQGYQHAEDDHTMLVLHRNSEGSPKAGLSAITNMIKDSFGMGHTDTIISA